VTLEDGVAVPDRCYRQRPAGSSSELSVRWTCALGFVTPGKESVHLQSFTHTISGVRSVGWTATDWNVTSYGNVGLYVISICYIRASGFPQRYRYNQYAL
jgi:hypothetical protein